MKRSEISTSARITIPDLLKWLAAFAFLAALYPVVHESIVQNVAELSTGSAWMAQLILPLAILVLFSLIYVKAIGGMPR